MEKNELIKSAYLACKDGQIESALKHYQQVYKIDPSDAGILCMMGYCYTKLGQLAEALKQYRRALLLSKKQKNQLKVDIIQKKMIRIDPDSVADFELELAAVTEKPGEETGEIKSLKQAITKEPKNPELLENAAEQLEKQQIMGEAAKYYLALGNVYYGAKKFDKAIELFHHILEIRPTYIQAHIALAESYVKKNSDSDAKKEYLYAAEQLIRNGDLERGQIYAQKAIQLKSIEAHYYLGVVFFQNNNLEEARKEFETLLKFKVNHQGGLILLAQLMQKNKQQAEAFGLYERLIKTDPKNADVMEIWAESAKLNGDSKLALEKYTKAMDTFAEQEQWERATLCAHHALQIDGENQELYLKSAEAAYNAGLVEQAAQSCHDLAAVLESQGKDQEANQMRKKAHEISGNTPSAAESTVSTTTVSNETPPVVDEPQLVNEAPPMVDEPPIVQEAPPIPNDDPPMAEAAPPVTQSASLTPVKTSHENNLEMMMNVADTYIQQGSLDEAIEVYQKILKSDPNNETVKSALTRVYAMFAGINPETAVARRSKGQNGEKDDHLVQREARERAQREAQVRSQRKPTAESGNAPKVEPADQSIMHALGNDKEDEVDGDNQDEFMTVTVAEIYTKQGLLNEALKIYQKILEIEPGNKEAKLKKQELEIKMKEQEKLRQQSEKKSEIKIEKERKAIEEKTIVEKKASLSDDVNKKGSTDDGQDPPPPKRRGRVSYV